MNRVLGSIEGTAVLSEVGPAASVRPVADQAAAWLQLIDPDEVAAFTGLGFGAQVAALATRAEAAGRQLVVRDFCTPNFLPRSYGAVEPSGILESVAALEAEGLVLRRVAVVRRSATVYESLRRSFAHLADMPLGIFSAAYSAFVASLDGVEVVRYEDLTSAPEAAFAAICEALGIRFDPTALERFAGFTACTGDLDLAVPSRAAALNRIEVLPDPPASTDRERALAHPLLRASDERLGYESVGPADPAWVAVEAVQALEVERGRHALARRAEIEALRSAVDALQAGVDALQAEAAAGVQRDAALRRELADARSHEAALREELAEVLSREADLRARFDGTCAELVRAEAIAGERRAQLDALFRILDERSGALRPGQGG